MATIRAGPGDTTLEINGVKMERFFKLDEESDVIRDLQNIMKRKGQAMAEEALMTGKVTLGMSGVREVRRSYDIFGHFTEHVTFDSGRVEKYPIYPYQKEYMAEIMRGDRLYIGGAHNSGKTRYMQEVMDLEAKFSERLNAMIPAKPRYYVAGVDMAAGEPVMLALSPEDIKKFRKYVKGNWAFGEMKSNVYRMVNIMYQGVTQTCVIDSDNPTEHIIPVKASALLEQIQSERRANRDRAQAQAAEVEAIGLAGIAINVAIRQKDDGQYKFVVIKGGGKDGAPTVEEDVAAYSSGSNYNAVPTVLRDRLNAVNAVLTETKGREEDLARTARLLAQAAPEQVVFVDESLAENLNFPVPGIDD